MMFRRCVDCFALMAANWALVHTYNTSSHFYPQLTLLMCTSSFFSLPLSVCVVLALAILLTSKHKDSSATVQPLEPCANWINKVIFPMNTTTLTNYLRLHHFSVNDSFTHFLHISNALPLFYSTDLLLKVLHFSNIFQRQTKQTIQHTFHLRNEFASFAWR